MANNIPPELLALLEEMVGGGLAEDQQALLQAQMEQAHQFRNTPMPQGRTVRDQYIAANPLEFANATARQIMGGQAENAIRGQQYANLDRTQGGVRAQLMSRLLREYQNPEESPPIPSSQYADVAPIPSSQYADVAPMSPDPGAVAAANPFPVPWEQSGPVGASPGMRPGRPPMTPQGARGLALMPAHRAVPAGANRFVNTPALYKIVFGE